MKRKLLAICGTIALITGLGMTADVAVANTHPSTQHASGRPVQPPHSKLITYDYWEHGDTSGGLSGFCLDDPNNGGSGTKMQVWSCHNVTQEKWDLPVSPQGHGYYNICDSSGMCLDDPGCSTTDGTRLQVWASLGDKAQSWGFFDAGHGQYFIQNWCGSQIDLTNDNNSDGAPVQMWHAIADDAQTWAYIAP